MLAGLQLLLPLVTTAPDVSGFFPAPRPPVSTQELMTDAMLGAATRQDAPVCAVSSMAARSQGLGILSLQVSSSRGRGA